MPLEADVLIVTVTKIESRAVLQTFEQATGHQAASQSIDNRIYFNLGDVNGAKVFLTQSENRICMPNGWKDCNELWIYSD